MSVANMPHELNASGAVATLSKVGKLAGSGILTTGEIHYVKKSDDPDYNQFAKITDSTTLFTDIQSALNACVSGRHDYVCVVTPYDNSAFEPATGLLMDKRFVHLVGVERNFSSPEINFSGTAGLVIGSAAAEASNPARGCEIGNLKLYTLLAGVIPVTIGTASVLPYDTYIRDCGVLSLSATRTVVCCLDYGNDLLVERGYWGTALISNNSQNLYTNDNGGSLGTTTWLDVILMSQATLAGDQFMTLKTGTNIHYFKDCTFLNDPTTATMTVAVDAPDANSCYFQNCHAFGCSGFAATGKGLVSPGGMGVNVAAADVFNPGLSIDSAEPVASDT